MTIVTTDDASKHNGRSEGLEPGHPGGHDAGDHTSPQARDRRERFALWLFIGGDLIFLLLELFTWFYLKALNTEDLWRGSNCTTANPCADGLGHTSIVHEVAKASPSYTMIIAALSIVAALFLWGVEHASRGRGPRSAVTGWSAAALLALLAGIAVQCYQFGVLPFTTIDGAYASTFEFFMGSTLAHLILLAIVTIGLVSRARLGKYDDGNFYQTRLIRMFGVWIAISACVLAIVMTAFA